MTDKQSDDGLPALPRPYVPCDAENIYDFYTAGQMHSYACTAAAAALAARQPVGEAVALGPLEFNVFAEVCHEAHIAFAMDKFPSYERALEHHYIEHLNRVAASPAPQAAQAEQAEAPSDDFIVRTNREYAAWCATHYNPDALDARGMVSLHGLWAWQEQERRKVATQPTASNAGERELSTPQAFQTLKAAIQADEGYAWSWHCVAWSCAFDEGLETGAANRAAARFMSMAFDIDTSKHPHFKPEHQRAALATKPPAGEQKPVSGIVEQALAKLCDALTPAFTYRGVSLRVSQEDHEAIRSALAGANTALHLLRTAPQPEQVAQDKEALTDLIAQHLSGTYHCTRVWEAWRVGTMSQDDFEDVGESDTPAELADAILAHLNKGATQ